MGKGPGGAELKIDIKLTTFGGMGKIIASVKIVEGRKVVLEYDAPMTKFEGSRGPEPWINRYESEEKYKEIASFLERWVRERVFTD